MNKPLILSGKEASRVIFEDLKKFFTSLKKQAIFKIIQVGDNQASNKYVKNKLKKAQELNVHGILIKLDEFISEEKLKMIIKNEADTSDGLIVQLPLPKHINTQSVLNFVPLQKDIDGLSEINQKNFYQNQLAFAPATARGIIMLLNFYNIDLKNKKAYVIGESNLVGKPTKYLLNKLGSITKSFNKKTGILGCEDADILIVAAGEKHLVKAENVKLNSIIVDVGINTLSNNKITGDVDFEQVSKKVFAISPVPGGVGPMTIIALFSNLKDAIKNNKS
ncbi:bifunctional 5,10-methylenetetrahydrofolate dehydrogenase/5,10-methenyltetrahydrofolate cyclohydrolase [Mesomycoplasma lagogenitalium]|uniref:Bifunctional protein FolD n=1 Tax=Mesomycoplasma lagogenitalium TaxID=171286 RepID=A0ABY8LU69_9BACT|nr:bifunctional 5,10-methylenetetrahydrofolate dehydrogenase/5,10-methenyltetrahydrofolate cyclohydrolase [Mesomycoplasma lagogenitalium]WGI36779.1 bifunctional 5,10-methylenetetrahydrofolate dehydrogenase/5,10-methenyltetrahydrofolate cyclohydrolase [Mesomycoplasma lagogenitalium]